MSFAQDQLLPPKPSALTVERFRTVGSVVRRSVTDGHGKQHHTDLTIPEDAVGSTHRAFHLAWLRAPEARVTPTTGQSIAVVDLFSGCGGLSLGVEEAARALGRPAETALAADYDEFALNVFVQNFRPADTHAGDVNDLADGTPGDPLSLAERRLRRRLGDVDLLIGGPPCQGNSDLNNHTRRNDAKNNLYLRMARFAEVTRPSAVLIENVPGVIHDRSGVVARTAAALRDLGYLVDSGVIAADSIGAAQARKRHFTLARLDRRPSVEDVRRNLAAPPMTVDDAISDLSVGVGPFDTPARPSKANEARIRYLFQHGLYDLPDSERPDCHRLKTHSYRSVYGRMRGDQPAPTITSGFGSTGQGRFVHPHHARTLTPHEAARLQGFPGSFSFDACNQRTALQQMIGNAVPSRLAYGVALELLR